MAAELSVAVIGAGGRGFTFAGIFRDEVPGVQVTAVAEPRQDYREEFAKRFGVPTRGLFSDWRELAESPRKYDAVVISTPDRLHAEAAVAFTKRGCHMLLEKPMATSLEDCRRIARAQEEAGTVTCVCHSLRYNAGFAKLKEVAASGRIGSPIGSSAASATPTGVPASIALKTAPWNRVSSRLTTNAGASLTSTQDLRSVLPTAKAVARVASSVFSARTTSSSGMSATGEKKTDVVISNRDAQVILTTAPYTGYLKNGRVMVVYD